MTETRQQRIERLLKHPKLSTGAELLERLKRHQLPATVEAIERGEKNGPNSQQHLFAPERTPQIDPESTNSPQVDI